MAKLARVLPGCPNHITQRGSRRRETFFGREDYRAYLELLAEWAVQAAPALIVPSSGTLRPIPLPTSHFRPPTFRPSTFQAPTPRGWPKRKL